MALPIDSELDAAWRALSGAGAREGWRIIPVHRAGSCTLHAGRRFPGNEEALIASFDGVKLPDGQQLPKGHGFEVVQLPLAQGHGPSAIGLVRESQGAPELFTIMAGDVASVLQQNGSASSGFLLQLFLRRIGTWQDFMQRSADERLSNEEELGLFGELLTLELLLDAGVDPIALVEAWMGPEGGIHDFVLGGGAIEVKSSIATQGFPIRIGSLDQLDDDVHRPLFLRGHRLAPDSLGQTLAERVKIVRERLGHAGAGARFATRLLHGGYVDGHRIAYARRFRHLETRFLLVAGDFPRLVRTTAGPAVRQAAYTMDLDLIEQEPVSVDAALASLGIRQDGSE